MLKPRSEAYQRNYYANFQAIRSFLFHNFACWFTFWLGHSLLSIARISFEWNSATSVINFQFNWNSWWLNIEYWTLNITHCHPFGCNGGTMNFKHTPSSITFKQTPQQKTVESIINTAICHNWLWLKHIHVARTKKVHIFYH